MKRTLQLEAKCEERKSECEYKREYSIKIKWIKRKRWEQKWFIFQTGSFKWASCLNFILPLGVHFFPQLWFSNQYGVHSFLPPSVCVEFHVWYWHWHSNQLVTRRSNAHLIILSSYELLIEHIYLWVWIFHPQDQNQWWNSFDSGFS